MLSCCSRYGPIHFDELGRNDKKPMAAVQIQDVDGDLNHVVVAPTVERALMYFTARTR